MGNDLFPLFRGYIITPHLFLFISYFFNLTNILWMKFIILYSRLILQYLIILCAHINSIFVDFILFYFIGFNGLVLKKFSQDWDSFSFLKEIIILLNSLHKIW